ncbi:hypothetical protein A9Q95_09990 [Rhodobacterales bacterium 59_46_T64]|nr:hypothetical protein A9Q95_09990 [Rhodobacterales bacterium 59_46_T64]
MTDAAIVRRNPDLPGAPEDARAEAIALAVMNAGTMAEDSLAPDAAWERSGAPCTLGRAAIMAAIGRGSAPRKIYVEQVVSQGKAATVSGRVIGADGGARLYCHVIRYTASSAQQVAQIVSFEHSVKVR